MAGLAARTLLKEKAVVTDPSDSLILRRPLMEARKPESVIGAATCIAFLLAVMTVAASIGCAPESDLGFSKSTPATPGELLTELKKDQEKIGKVTEGMLQRH